MEERISLCIPYVYHPFGEPENSKNRLFRIADYNDGVLSPIDVQTFDDDNPKYVRYIGELDLYKPILRTWWIKKDKGTEKVKRTVIHKVFY